jgi:hypothetical protein
MKSKEIFAVSLNEGKFKDRIALVDNVKGILVIIFALSQIAIQIQVVGGGGLWLFEKLPIGMWYWHSNDVGGPVGHFWGWLGFNFLDLGPMAFFYLIGIVVFRSFEKRAEYDGKKAALKRFFMRNAAIVGIFLPACMIGAMFIGEVWNWQTIPSIGFTGMLLSPFIIVLVIRKKWWAKLAAGLGVLAFYHFGFDFLQRFSGIEGGPAACFGYLAVVIFAAMFGDFQAMGNRSDKGRGNFNIKGIIYYTVATAAFFGFAALIKRLWGPSDYDKYNPTYMVMGLSVINIAYYVLYIFDKLVLKGRPIPILAAMGRNIMLYLILTSFALGIIFNIVPFFKTVDGPEKLYVVQAVVTAAYLLLAVFLQKKKIAFKL